MKIGSLYIVKKYFWLLFPSKETAAAPAASGASVAPTSAGTADVYADYWSMQLKCEVTYFSPDSYIVFLEEDTKLKKVLTSDGMIGWTWFSETYNESFEEVNP